MLEDGRVASVVLGAEGGGLAGGTFYEVGEAYAVVGEAVVVFHGHGDLDETRLVEGSPEAVSGVGEVVTSFDGDLGGVEADQDYVEVVFEVVGEGVHGLGSLCAVNLAFAGVGALETGALDSSLRSE